MYVNKTEVYSQQVWGLKNEQSKSTEQSEYERQREMDSLKEKRNRVNSTGNSWDASCSTQSRIYNACFVSLLHICKQGLPLSVWVALAAQEMTQNEVLYPTPPHPQRSGWAAEQEPQKC